MVEIAEARCAVGLADIEAAQGEGEGMSAPTATTLDLGAIPGELRAGAPRLGGFSGLQFEQREDKTTKVPYRADGEAEGELDRSRDVVIILGAAVAGHSALKATTGSRLRFRTTHDPCSSASTSTRGSARPSGSRSCCSRSPATPRRASATSGVPRRSSGESLNGHERNRRGPIEVYEAGRYFVVTGAHVPGTPTTIETRQDELAKGIERFLSAPTPVEPRERQAAAPVDLDDRELLERAFAAKNGARVEALWNGDTSGHGGDDSAADLALVGALAFWTGPDPARIDALFRRSGLMRPKNWDERRGESTYGAQTIERALEVEPTSTS